jgi:Holliday junction resolvase-like predicted endonuclease
VRVENDRLHLDPNQFNRLCTDIDADIRIIGGGIVLFQMFGYLKDTNQYEFERYIPGRVFGTRPRLPSLPVGYLLNLGVKHLDKAPLFNHEVAGPIWKRIAERARDFCALFDVEPYHNIENIVLPPRELPAYLGSVALFDHLFAFHQWRPSEAINLIAAILDFVDPERLLGLVGWTLNDALKLTEFALTKASVRDMYCITDEDIIADGIDVARWHRMRPHFVHGLGMANRSYLAPRDANKSDFCFKPFIEIHNKQLLLISSSICALAFFEAITRAARDAGYPELDNQMGRALERVAANAFRAHGITPTVHGNKKYKMLDPSTGKKQEGECDLVVGTLQRIVFVELKKQPHRHVSSTGNALANLIDLSASLFHAQHQLARHERILLHSNHLLFENGYRLDYGRRGIERMAITLLDYGGLQDKYLLKQLFAALVGADIKADGIDTDTAKKLSKLNKYMKQLLSEAKALEKLGQSDKLLFLNCWFLSMPQLLLLLDGVTNADELG